MKLKMDFVSNSSSTSFVYISRDMLTLEDFMAAAGIGENSPVAPLFHDMYRELHERLEQGDTLTSVEEIDNMREQDRFTDDVIAKMKAAVQQGQFVTVGSFSSENNLAETILCTEIFEISSEGFFINAYENYW